MYNIKANNTWVLTHADIVEEGAKEQIDKIAHHPAIKGRIAIMPDVHGGVGTVIGFTGRFKDAVIANLVGVDIGCGVITYKLDATTIDYSALDKYIRDNIPLGFASRGTCVPMAGLDNSTIGRIVEVTTLADKFLEDNGIKSKRSPLYQLGTLGGGNHFIEVDKAKNGQYLTIHSGSRNFGLKVANHFQSKAKMLTNEMNLEVPNDLEYLPMSFGGNEYLQMLKIAQEYAHLNRILMLNIILRFFGEEIYEAKMIESVHNYIGRDSIIRKGAISAYKGEKVVIPLHMGAGIVIGTGKGNEEYNYSAPHGAGRMFGRKEMLRRLEAGTEGFSIERYKDLMKGVFSTSICRETFDESPDAYKPWESISEYLTETVDVEEIAKPVYNLKSLGK